MQEFLSPTGNPIFAEDGDSLSDSTSADSDKKPHLERDRDPEMLPVPESKKHSSEQPSKDDDRGELAEKLATIRLRIASALNRQFKMTVVEWQNCSGQPCKSSDTGTVFLVLGSPASNADRLDEVLGYLDKVFRTAQISRLTIKPSKPGDDSKYHVVSTEQSPEPVELLASITNTALALQNGLRSSDDKSTTLSPVDALIATACKDSEQPLMSNLLVAFERKRLLLEHTETDKETPFHESAEFHFDQALVLLTAGKPIADQELALQSISKATDELKCQAATSVQLLHCLKLISEHSSLTKSEATQAANLLLQNLPDSLYRIQALYDLALRAKCNNLPGLTGSDSEKDTLHGLTIIWLLIGIALSSPVFAILTFKRLYGKSDGIDDSQDLSAVHYGFKRMVAVVLTLTVSLFLIVSFEYVAGFDSAIDRAMMALYHPSQRILCDLVASSLFNLPIFLVYFLWCIPKGISFSEGFGLRFSTLKYSFKQLCVTGLFAYLVVSVVTASTMILMVIFHHPDSTNDTSSSIATTMSPLAAVLMFFVESLAGPVLEELCFRGVLYRGLRASWGILPSLIVSSLWFAVLHGEFAPWLLFHKFAVGAVNALLYEKTRSLVPSIVAHCLNNIFLDIT